MVQSYLHRGTVSPQIDDRSLQSILRVQRLVYKFLKIGSGETDTSFWVFLEIELLDELGVWNWIGEVL